MGPSFQHAEVVPKPGWYPIRYHFGVNAAAIVRDARMRAQLGLREMARRASTSHATLHAYEAGAKTPRVDTLDDITAAAGFALEVTLAVRRRVNERGVARGDELAEVLELAAAFPARHGARLQMPVFRKLAP
jgi:transcriptional regulator with XRE-family HTH domain